MARKDVSQSDFIWGNLLGLLVGIEGYSLITKIVQIQRSKPGMVIKFVQPMPNSSPLGGMNVGQSCAALTLDWRQEQHLQQAYDSVNRCLGG